MTVPIDLCRIWEVVGTYVGLWETDACMIHYNISINTSITHPYHNSTHLSAFTTCISLSLSGFSFVLRRHQMLVVLFWQSFPLDDRAQFHCSRTEKWQKIFISLLYTILELQVLTVGEAVVVVGRCRCLWKVEKKRKKKKVRVQRQKWAILLLFFLKCWTKWDRCLPDISRFTGFPPPIANSIQPPICCSMQWLIRMGVSRMTKDFSLSLYLSLGGLLCPFHLTWVRL